MTQGPREQPSGEPVQDQPASGGPTRRRFLTAVSTAGAVGLSGLGPQRRTVRRADVGRTAPGGAPIVGTVPSTSQPTLEEALASAAAHADAIEDLLSWCAVALDAGAIARSYLNPASPATDAPIFGPAVPLGHAVLDPILMEHDARALEAHGQVVTERLARTDIVIPEYYGPEQDRITNPRLRRYIDEHRADNVLFDLVEKVCRRKGKDVWVLDPAHNGSFLQLIATPEAAALASGVVGTAAVAHLSRGIAPAAYALLRATLQLHTLPTGHELIENDFRRVVVAQHLADLCGSTHVAEGQVVTPVYALGHWAPPNGRPGIQHYLQHPEQRARRLRAYGFLFRSPDLHQPRFYPKGIADGAPRFTDLVVDPQRSAGSVRTQARARSTQNQHGPRLG